MRFGRITYHVGSMIRLPPEDGDDEPIFMMVPTEVPVQRFSLPRAIRDIRRGIYYGYPWCCIVAFAWWGFWHGAPQARYESRSGIWWGGLNYVPCHRHWPTDEAGREVEIMTPHEAIRYVTDQVYNVDLPYAYRWRWTNDQDVIEFYGFDPKTGLPVWMAYLQQGDDATVSVSGKGETPDAALVDVAVNLKRHITEAGDAEV